MGPRSSLILAFTLASSSVSAAPKVTSDKVLADFEAAVKKSRDAYVDLFDFHAVGEMEILLHRYDLLGRLKKLPEDIQAQFAAEDGTPYPAEREKKNVGSYYKPLAQRTVGSGGCVARVTPRTRYAKLLGTYEPLPAHVPPKYHELQKKAAAAVAKGGVVSFTCKGGKGGIALVWTETASARGYDLITIYED